MQLIQSTIGAIDTVNSLREGDDWMVIVSHSSLTSRGSVEVPYACISYDPPRIVHNFSQPSEGVRSNFKVLTHTTDYDVCVKIGRNVVRRRRGGVKLYTVGSIFLACYVGRFGRLE